MKRAVLVTICVLLVAAAVTMYLTRPSTRSITAPVGSATASATTDEAIPNPNPAQVSPLDTVEDKRSKPPTTDQQATRDPEVPTGLRIRVIDDVDRAVSGASIWVIPSQPYEFPPKREIDSIELCNELAEARGVSDGIGRFYWPELTPARHLIVARKGGYAAGYAWVEQTRELTPTISIELRRGGGVRGIVYDGNASTPAAGAFVTMMPRARPGFERDPFATFVRFFLGAAIRTSADGRFALDELSGETSELFCTLPGRPQICIDWIIPTGQELSLKFVENVTISGTVTDEGGAPIAGANIYVTTPGVLPLPTTEPVHSDEHGEFLCDTVTPGPIEVKVDKRGFGVFKQPFVARDAGESFDIVLKPEVEFAGTVVDLKGRPIQGAAVRVVDAKQFVMCGQMDSLKDGSWYMYWVPEGGPIDVYVTRKGFIPSNTRGITAPQKALRIEMQASGGFDGRVVDPEGRPITRFAFRCASRGDTQVEEYYERIDRAWYPVVSPDGHFGFVDGRIGLTEVSVRAAGYRPKTVSDISIGPGESVGPVEFRLERSPTVRGTVVDPIRKPVVGASVEIAESAFDGRAALTREPFGSTTGIDGSFVIDTVPDGSFTLVVRRGENRGVFADLRSGDFPRDFVVEPEGDIIGSVNGSWTRPETCVRIRISLDRTWIGREIRPDADGRFHVSDLAPGDYRIELIDDWSEYEHLRDGRVTSFATVRSGETTVVMLDATGAGVIEGRVVTKGSRLAGQQISLRAFAVGKEERPVAESTVDGNGLFRFDHLHGGTYRIRVGSYERGTSLALDREVTVPENGTVGPIEIVIGGGGLQGRVLRDDGSPADARVALVDSSKGQEVAAVRTDADGTYRLLSAPDGSYVVVASAASFADGYAGPVTFPGSGDAPAIEQRLQRESRVLARVRDDLGRPVGGALVEIDVTTKPAPLRRQSLTSDSQGQAEFVRLPAGSLSISASRVGYVPADPIVVGLAADQRRTVDLLLTRCGSLDVVAKDGRGQALAGIELSAALAEGDPRGESSRHTKTNIRGGARFTGLRPGRWQVSGDATNQVTVDIEAGGSATAELIGQR